jgi:hypothetical protein
VPLPRFRLSIAHLMWLTFVVALALAPALAGVRSGRTDVLVAALAFDVIMLPMIVALIVLVMMEPGRPRDYVLMALCSAPILVVVATTLVGEVISVAVAVYWGQYSALFWLAWMAFRFIRSRRVRRACPACGGSNLQWINRHDPEKKMYVPCYQCKNCGMALRLQWDWLGGETVRESPADPPAGRVSSSS